MQKKELENKTFCFLSCLDFRLDEYDTKIVKLPFDSI